MNNLNLDDNDSEFNNEMLELADKTYGFSGAEIINICRAQVANNRKLAYLTKNDYLYSISKNQRRTNKEMVKLYEDFASKFCNLKFKN